MYIVSIEALRIGDNLDNIWWVRLGISLYFLFWDNSLLFWITSGLFGFGFGIGMIMWRYFVWLSFILIVRLFHLVPDLFEFHDIWFVVNVLSSLCQIHNERNNNWLKLGKFKHIFIHYIIFRYMHHIILKLPNPSLFYVGKLIALCSIGAFFIALFIGSLSGMFWNEVNPLVSPIYSFLLVIVWKCGGGVSVFLKKILDIELIALDEVGVWTFNKLLGEDGTWGGWR